MNKDLQKFSSLNKDSDNISSLSSAAHLKSLTKDQTSISSSAGVNPLTMSPKSSNNQTATQLLNQDSNKSSQQQPDPTEAELFIKMFQDMNEKAIESMNKDEPETALEFLKKCDETLKKLQQKQSIGLQQNTNQHQDNINKRLNNQSIDKSAKNRSGISNQQNISGVQQSSSDDQIDPNYKASLYYNLACCYQRLGMLEECVDYLELATKALNKKIIMLEDEENAMLFNINTDPNSIDGDYTVTNKDKAGGTNKTSNRRQNSNYEGINTSVNHQVSTNSQNSSHHHRYQTTSAAHQQTLTGLSKSPNQRIVLSDQKKVKKQSREKLLASKLHKLRYQCKFNLQLCAILSQINQHRDALIYGHKSSALCAKLVKEAQLLCKRFMHQIQRSLKREQERQNQMSNNQPNTNVNGNNAGLNMSNYNTMTSGTGRQLINRSGMNQTGILNDSSLQQDSVHSNRTSGMNINNLNNSNYSINQRNKMQNNRANTALGQGIAVNYIQKSKNSRSSVNSIDRNNGGVIGGDLHSQSKRSHSSQSEKLKRRNDMDKSVDSVSSPKSSVTRLRIYKNPFVRGDSMNESQLSKYRDRDNSNESLERIHTFSLKNSFQKIKKPDDKTADNKDGDKSQSQSRKESKPSSLTRQSIETLLKKESTEDGTGGNKTYYVEESVKILENIIMKADPILSELASKVKQFEKIANQSAHEREQDLLDKYGVDEYEEQRRKLKVSFHHEDEINELKHNGNYKMSVRNVLGLRHSDDWIFNLNIGNVMHLSLMGAEELNAKLETTHELCKDSMLEKIVLVSVSFFCIGTEMRFLMQKQNSTITKKDSEAFHAKALHISCLFLPHDCPLVIHIVNSYTKNYLKDKKPQKKIKSDNQASQQSRPRSRQTNQQYGSNITQSPIQIQNQQHQRPNDQQQEQQSISQAQNNSSIITRMGRGKHQQPTQQQVHLSQTISNPRTSGSNGDSLSQEDTNSNPHSIDAKANRVHSTQMSHQINRPVQMPNNNQDFFKQNNRFIQNMSNGPIQGQGGQPQSNMIQKLQIDISRQPNLNTIEQISQVYKLHPQSTKHAQNSQQQASNFLSQQAFILNDPGQMQNTQLVKQQLKDVNNPNYQRFINSRPSIDPNLQHSNFPPQQQQHEHMYQNFIDIDLSDDMPLPHNQQQQQQQQKPQNSHVQNNQYIQHQQQINNLLLQQQMQQLNLQQNPHQQQQQSNSSGVRSKQVKSQMNQISHISMTSQLHNGQQQQQQYNYQNNSNSNAQNNNIITNLRANLRTPTMNQQQQQDRQINSQLNNHVFNTIDHRSGGVNSSDFDTGAHHGMGGITINYHQSQQQPINIQIMTQQQQQMQHAHSLNTSNNITGLQQQQPALINPKKKIITSALQQQLGKSGQAVSNANRTAVGSQLSINQKGKLNITSSALHSQTQKRR